MRIPALVAIALTCTLTVPVCRAQVTTGTPPFGSFSGGPDVVNLANLNVELSIPIVNKSGRGLPFNYALSYNSSGWYPLSQSGTVSWQPNSYFSWGWGSWDGPVIGNLHYSVTGSGNCYDYSKYPPQKTGTYEDLSQWLYVDQVGTPHQFSPATMVLWTSGTCPSGPAQNLMISTSTKDGSGDLLSATGNSSGVSSWTVTQGNGTTINVNYLTNVEKITDRNGNYISTPGGANYSFTDTLGYTAISTPGPLPPNPATYTYTGPSGNVSFAVKYKSYVVRTNFGCSGITEWGPYTKSLVSEIDLPDGSKYTFTYESTPNYSGDITGRIAEITLPTGGSISYTYGGGSNGITCSDGTTATLTRTVTPGGSEPATTWTYAHTESGSNWFTLITDPAGNQTYTKFASGYEFERDAYKGTEQSGTLLQTVDTCYNGATPPPCSSSATLPITQRSVFTKMPLGSTTLESEKNFTYDQNSGAPKEEDDYGYGSGTVGILMRKTIIQYASLGNNISTMPGEITIQSGSGATLSDARYSYDETGVVATTGTPQHASISGSRGNATTVKTLVAGSTFLTKTFTYFDTGNVDVAQDVNQAQTSYTYGNCGNSFATSIALPLGLSESATWNCNGGVVTSISDPNGKQTNYTYNDPYFWRLAQVTYPDGGWQAFSYPSLNDVETYTGITNPTPSTSCSTGCRHDQSLLDGVGRADENVLVSDPDGETTVTTTYDPANAQIDVTNPDRSGATTNGTTTTTSDTLGRTTAIQQPDGDVTHTYYGSDVSSNGGIGTQLCSTSTYGYGLPALTVDAAGMKSEIWKDAFGRTIEADEPDSSNNLTKATCSLYDAKGNLTQVVSATGQTRTYVYDDLGRAASVTTPETSNLATTYLFDSADSACSSYSSNGDLVERKDAAGKTACYQYDGLHRVTSISYSDGTHSVSFDYDQSSYNGLSISNGKGRRTGMSDGSGQTAWSYDAMGRIISEEKTVSGITKTLGYTYNYDGSLAAMTYPDGRVVNYAYNNAERPTSAIDNTGPINYSTGATYWPQGALDVAVHGSVSGGFGGITETWGYNNDLEPTSVAASSSNGTALNLSYSYALPGGNNGGVAGVTNGKDSGRNLTLGYDPLDRLLNAQTAATSGQDCWGLNFGSGGLADDTVGNLTSMSVSKCSGPSLSVSVSGNNQITNTGFSYDAAGNATADGQYSYAYNAENEITSANGVSYTYDGDGLRVEKSSGTLYWRSSTGAVIEETNTSGNMQRDYIFFAGRRIAWRDSSGNVYYYFADALGSERAVTNATGSTCFDADYYPYGQENDYNTSCSPTYKFTGYEYDSETGNYYAFARYYSPRLGRFMSIDALGGSVSDPQSQNRYTYTANNPSSFVDPVGLCKISPDGTQWVEANQPPPCPPLGQYISVGNCIIFIVSYLDSPSSPPTSLVEDLMGCGDDNWSGHWDTTAYPGDNGNSQGDSQQSTTSKALTVLACASDTANKYSLAGLVGLNNKKGFWGTVGKGLLGNTFSGIYDTSSHIAQVFGAQNSGQRAAGLLKVQGDLIVGGASQGVPIGDSGLLGNGVAGTVTDAAANTAAKAFPAIEGALTEAGTTAAEAVGWVKAVADLAVFTGSAAYCYAHK